MQDPKFCIRTEYQNPLSVLNDRGVNKEGGQEEWGTILDWGRFTALRIWSPPGPNDDIYS